MDIIIVIGALSGAIGAGFVAGDYLSRMRDMKLLKDTAQEWRAELAKISTVHNAQAQMLADLADRLGGVEMATRGTTARR